MSVNFNNGTDCVNFSNTNAVAVLRALGIEPFDECGDLYGQMGGAEFRERVMLALATDAQVASPGFEDRGWAHVGRSATYMQERLPELAELSRGAGEVWWG
ncbi:hypothetical protein [Nocardiopsis sp. FR26]|uniref:hypothetical protein n=1 Tax=Nocardiopsis sp. FR26 TaxID=2605987 RepID=UPI001357B847|nr:hypothetical protein [Nocardiopsis sp. FR26]